jgi:hypothetical protein
MLRVLDAYLKGLRYKVTNADWRSPTSEVLIYQRFDAKTTADAPRGFRVQFYNDGDGGVVRLAPTLNGLPTTTHGTFPIEDVPEVIGFLHKVTKWEREAAT